MLFANVDSQFYINTDYVKPEEIRSAKDLLNPKFTGKISSEDPTSSGTGANTAGHILRELGPEFTKALYRPETRHQPRAPTADRLAGAWRTTQSA